MLWTKSATSLRMESTTQGLGRYDGDVARPADDLHDCDATARAGPRSARVATLDHARKLGHRVGRGRQRDHEHHEISRIESGIHPALLLEAAYRLDVVARVSRPGVVVGHRLGVVHEPRSMTRDFKTTYLKSWQLHGDASRVAPNRAVSNRSFGREALLVLEQVDRYVVSSQL